MADCRQEVPEQEALLLEFPGIVTNPLTVLGSFGGPDAVSQVLGGTREALHLKLRPEDPLAQSMLGLKQPAHGLLLRLSRKAGTPTAPCMLLGGIHLLGRLCRRLLLCCVQQHCRACAAARMQYEYL